MNRFIIFVLLSIQLISQSQDTLSKDKVEIGLFKFVMLLYAATITGIYLAKHYPEESDTVLEQTSHVFQYGKAIIVFLWKKLHINLTIVDNVKKPPVNKNYSPAPLLNFVTHDPIKLRQ